MTQTSHTPGPWIAWDDGRSIGIADASGEPIQIAEIVDGADMADPDQLLADQRLIAAAPRMLAALQHMVATAKQSPGGFPAIPLAFAESVLAEATIST